MKTAFRKNVLYMGMAYFLSVQSLWPLSAWADEEVRWSDVANYVRQINPSETTLESELLAEVEAEREKAQAEATKVTRTQEQKRQRERIIQGAIGATLSGATLLGGFFVRKALPRRPGIRCEALEAMLPRHETSEFHPFEIGGEIHQDRNVKSFAFYRAKDPRNGKEWFHLSMSPFGASETHPIWSHFRFNDKGEVQVFSFEKNDFVSKGMSAKKKKALQRMVDQLAKAQKKGASFDSRRLVPEFIREPRVLDPYYREALDNHLRRRTVEQERVGNRNDNDNGNNKPLIDLPTDELERLLSAFEGSQ